MSTRAEDVSTHAVSPLSILGAGAVPGAGGVATAGPAAGGACASTGLTAAPRTRTIARTNGNRFTRLSFSALERGLVTFARPDPDRRLHQVDEDLAVADVARLRRGDHDLGDLVGEM